MGAYGPSSNSPHKNVLLPVELWDADTAYTELSVVFYNGSLWVAAADNEDSEPSASNADWTLAVGGDRHRGGGDGDDDCGSHGAQINLLETDPPELIPGQPGRILRFLSIASQTTPGTIPHFENNHFAVAYTGSTETLTVGALIVSNGLEATFSTESVTDGTQAIIYPLNDVTGIGFSVAEGSDDPNGAILTSSRGAAGTDYVPGDTFEIAGGTGATGAVTTVGALGVVTAYTITAAGFDYNVANGKATTATTGIGSGLTINVLTVTPANGTCRLWITYQVFDAVT